MPRPANSASRPHLSPMSEFHSLATLIKRLEVATTRLEDLALSGTSASTVTATNPTAAAPAASTQTKEVQLELPPAVEQFSNALAGPVKKYVELSTTIGGPVLEQVCISWVVYSRLDTARQLL